MTRIEAIRARAEAATDYIEVSNEPGESLWFVAHDLEVRYPIATCGECGGWAGFSEPDAEFIAHARQDIPDLLAAIDKVRAIHLPQPIRSKLWCLECESHYPCPTVRALGGDS